MSGPTEALSLARSVLAAQPFNEVVGATIERFDDGVAILELEIADRHRQQFGLVHGGVYAYLVDNALTFACGTVLGADIITSGLSITYLAPARGGTLRATATVTAHDRKHAVATVVVDRLDGDSTQTCAVGQGSALRTRGTAS